MAIRKSFTDLSYKALTPLLTRIFKQFTFFGLITKKRYPDFTSGNIKLSIFELVGNVLNSTLEKGSANISSFSDLSLVVSQRNETLTLLAFSGSLYNFSTLSALYSYLISFWYIFHFTSQGSFSHWMSSFPVAFSTFSNTQTSVLCVNLHYLVYDPILNVRVLVFYSILS